MPAWAGCAPTGCEQAGEYADVKVVCYIVRDVVYYIGTFLKGGGTMGLAVLDEADVLLGEEGVWDGVVEAAGSGISAIDREDDNRMSYIAYVINEFPEAFKMEKQKGYLYLEQYGGLDYLCKHWWALHIKNQREVMNTLFDVCKKNGGYMR
jgi:hypothetical protein